MPMFDFKCKVCGEVSRDVLLLRFDSVFEHCHTPAEKLVCSPAFVVKGFNSANGFSGGQRKWIKQKEKNLEVYVDS